MKQWNGLLRKEWIQWRWMLLVLAILLVTGLFVLPSVAKVFAVNAFSVFEATMVLCFLVAGFSALVPVISLATMVNRDLKHPDLWLHSTASTTKLVGAKMTMAALIGVGSLLIPTAVLAIRYAISDVSIITFDELFFFGSLFITFIFFASLMYMVIGFFFLVIDQLLKRFVNSFSIAITLVLFILSIRVYGEVVNSSFYEKLSKFGKIDLMAIKNPTLEIGYGFFAYTETVLYAGDLLWAVLFTVGLFLGGISIFDKQVRL
ncbi:hypothetical protein MHZ92_04840 [Sporosarcina sp. ACRSL]|uniref:hypothetical protein n=1 Tax=Sporosarcina sp. ACRSL TaxID=2918215 RepID=UPI001EF67D6A|nr:hypothetical protein [Sporosarcina sp. ACRSL]MCG7343446.1 hypothetical protein [Sporosarcina sp. ACRSL]